MAKGWRGYKSYGKSAFGVDFNVEGLDKLLMNVEKAGSSIDAAVEDAVQQSAPLILEDMKRGAQRHRDKGDVLEAIEGGRVITEGNYTYIQVGVDVGKHPEAKHAVFQEYGDGHSPGFPDPFVRPSMENNRRTILGIMRSTLKKWGIPVE